MESQVRTSEPENGTSEVEAESSWKSHGHVLWAEWIKPLFIIGLLMFSFRSAA